MAATSRVTLRPKNQLTLPDAVRQALHAQPGDEIDFQVQDDGHVTVRALRQIPADQAWFWSPEWQAGEREVDIELASGGGAVYHNIDRMFADLDAPSPAAD